MTWERAKSLYVIFLTKQIQVRSVQRGRTEESITETASTEQSIYDDQNILTKQNIVRERIIGNKTEETTILCS